MKSSDDLHYDPNQIGPSHTLNECLNLESDDEPEQPQKLWMVLNVKQKNRIFKLQINKGQNAIERINEFCYEHQIGDKNKMKLVNTVAGIVK